MMDVAKVIRDGFRLWNRNHIMGMPYALSLLSAALAFAVSAIVVALAAAASGPFAFFTILLVSAVMLIFFLVAVIVSQSYFQAAAVSMARKANDGESLSWEDGYRAPQSGFFKVLIINVTVGAAIFAVMAGFAVAQMVLQVNLLFPVSLAAGCALMFSPFFAVLTDKDWGQSVKAATVLAWRNKASVALLWAFISYVDALALFILLPPSLLAAAALTPVIFLAGGQSAGGTALLAIILAVVLYVAASVAFSVFVISPLATAWHLVAFNRLRGDDK